MADVGRGLATPGIKGGKVLKIDRHVEILRNGSKFLKIENHKQDHYSFIYFYRLVGEMFDMQPN